ncbi:hypothetical protein OSTOST_21716 [Ostertagia ostertagi]
MFFLDRRWAMPIYIEAGSGGVDGCNTDSDCNNVLPGAMCGPEGLCGFSFPSTTTSTSASTSYEEPTTTYEEPTTTYEELTSTYEELTTTYEHPPYTIHVHHQFGDHLQQPRKLPQPSKNPALYDPCLSTGTSDNVGNICSDHAKFHNISSYVK